MIENLIIALSILAMALALTACASSPYEAWARDYRLSSATGLLLGGGE